MKDGHRNDVCVLRFAQVSLWCSKDRLHNDHLILSPRNTEWQQGKANKYHIAISLCEKNDEKKKCHTHAVSVVTPGQHYCVFLQANQETFCALSPLPVHELSS